MITSARPLEGSIAPVLLRALLRRPITLAVSRILLSHISDRFASVSPVMSGGATVRRWMSAVNEDQSPLLLGKHPFYNPVAGEFVVRVKRLISSDPVIAMMAAPDRRNLEALALLLLYPNLKISWRSGTAFRADRKRVECRTGRLYKAGDVLGLARPVRDYEDGQVSLVTLAMGLVLLCSRSKSTTGDKNDKELYRLVIAEFQNLAAEKCEQSRVQHSEFVRELLLIMNYFASSTPSMNLTFTDLHLHLCH